MMTTAKLQDMPVPLVCIVNSDVSQSSGYFGKLM